MLNWRKSKEQPRDGILGRKIALRVCWRFIHCTDTPATAPQLPSTGDVAE